MPLTVKMEKESPECFLEKLSNEACHSRMVLTLKGVGEEVLLPITGNNMFPPLIGTPELGI